MQNDLVKFKLTIRTVKKGDLTDFENVMIFGARMSASKTADLLR